ncbi:MAG TPA: DUF2339 domain-containing protein [Candidatus Baltobacteraceae bacterium]|nr:DUF2339 domain-containing protein [Candidatus Baltobacteraceae bacterium]
MADDERTAALEARVGALEQEVRTLRSYVFAPSAVPVKPAVVKTKPPAPPEPFPAPLPSRPAFNAEAFFGGRLLLAVGALAFLIGVGFFLKYAFDNGWIGPSGRVAIGLIGGIALVYGGDRFFRVGQRYYAEALTGLGAAVLYLSLWAAGSYFHLLPLGVTFAAMIVVTAGIMTIALARDAQRLAFAAISGGMLTPALNAGPSANLTVLFSYLAILDMGLLWLVARRWARFEAVAFVGTQLWLLAQMPWNAQSWTPDVSITLQFATIFLVLFTVPVFMRAHKFTDAHAYEIVMAVFVPAVYYTEIYSQLYDLHRMWLTGATVALAAAYLCAASVLRGRMRETAAAIALTLVTIGVGITFTGSTQAIAWAVEAAALVICGARMPSAIIRVLGYVTFLCSIRIMETGLRGGALFANPRFATLLVTALACGAVAVIVDRLAERVHPERYLGEAAEALAHFFLLIAVGYELVAAFHTTLLPISLLMLVYAVLLVGAGFARKRVFTRWEGLLLFALLVVKVFFMDMASFDTVVRIVSFLAVGGVLLIVAFLYQRAQAGAEIA